MANGQGTIEYLVILAIIVIISLVVVSLMVSSTGSAGGIGEGTLKISSQASPISVAEVTANPDGNIYLEIGNNTGENITINSIQVGGSDMNTDKERVEISGERGFILPTSILCTEGTNEVLEIVIFYETSNGLTKRQEYPDAIIIPCEETEISATNVVIAEETGTEANPIVTLSSPADNAHEGDGLLDFVFNLENASGVNDCELLFDTVGIDNLTPSEGPNTFSNIDISSYNLDEAYVWDVECTKGATTYGSGSPRNITYPSIYLTSTGTGMFLDSEDLEINYNPGYDSGKTYHVTWYKDGDVNATTMIETDLLSYWPLDNDVVDYWGSGGGTNVGASPAPGVVNGAYRFSRPEGDQINIDYALTITASVSMWVNTAPNTSDYYSFPMGRYNFSQPNSYAVRTETNDICCYMSTDPYEPLATFCDKTTHDISNAWHHVVCTFDGTTTTLYLDSVPIKSQSFAPATLGTTTIAGAAMGASANPTNIGRWSGDIDELLIFERGLTADEVKQLYYAQLYGGDHMDSGFLTAGEEWKVGYKTNDGGGWSADVNSAPVTIG